MRRASRRRFLAGAAAVGGIAVAGCSGLPWRDDSSPPFTAADADAVLTTATPSVKWPVPLAPDAAAVDDGIARVDSLLADVPDPLEVETVPNGVVRESITDRRDEARDRRDDAAAATGDDRYHALRTTRGARSAARDAAVAFAAIEDEMAVEALPAERSDARSAVRDLREAIDYRGPDGTDDQRLRSALFFASFESDLETAANRLERGSVDATPTVLEIGEAAGDLEFATATTTVWDHLDARYDDRIDEPVDLTSAFEVALEKSIDRAETVGLPDRRGEEWFDEVLDVDLEDDRLRHMLWRAGDEIARTEERMIDGEAEGALGTGLHEALRFEQRYRAFERLCDRLEDGTLSAPGTVDDILTERTAAIEAAESARETVTAASIGTHVLGETLRSLAWTDDGVRRAADNDRDTAVSLGREHGEYARVRARFEVLPKAVDAFRERLLAG